MERSAVSSSNIVSVGYDPDMMTLEVEFNNGGIYQYFSVPNHVYEELMGADSLGSYLHHHIKNIYEYSKI